MSVAPALDVSIRLRYDTRCLQDSVASKVDVDIAEMDILALALGISTHIEGVDLHEHLFVTLLLLLHVDKFGSLVQIGLSTPLSLFDLGFDFRFSFGKLGEIDSRSLTFVDGIELDRARHGKRSRHVLRLHLDGLL